MLNLLWDLDGTLVDSMPVIAKALNETLLSYGKVERPLESLRPFIGPELGESLSNLLVLNNAADIENAKQVYRSFFAREMLNSPAFSGIDDVLSSFQASGVRQFVATAKYRHFAVQIVEALGLSSRFVAIYGSEADGRLGDKRDLLAHILAEEALSTGNTIMIGDTRFDIEAGRANKLTTVGVLWGYGGKDALEEAGAHFLAEYPGQMPEIIRQASSCCC
ncbi:MAG: HAD hydrolase-like protein [Reinekea sp.]